MTGTNLDPENPRDVLLAIPAVHYMDRLGNGLYRFRVSLKSPGSTVLGANALMGHRLNFDLAGGRIGFAEAGSCFDDRDRDDVPKTYQEKMNGGGEKQDDTAPAVEGGGGASASLSSPWTSDRDRMITPEMTFSFYVPYLAVGGTLSILALVLLIRDRACRKWSGTNRRRDGAGGSGPRGPGVSLALS